MKTTNYNILIILLSLFCGVQLSYSQNLNNTIKDTRDGQIYKTIEIENQIWMAETLNFNTPDAWWYDNKEENGKKYGRL